MRSIISNRLNSNVLGIRQDRRVAAVKDVLGMVLKRASFYFRHACETLAQHLTHERQLKCAAVGGTAAAAPASYMSLAPASCGPRCWRPVPTGRRPSVIGS
jgi:hypothetical protein